MKKFIPPSLAAVILAGLACMSSVDAETVYQENSKTVVANERSFIGNYVAWRTNCTSKPLKIEIIDAPVNGHLLQEVGLVPIEGVVTGSLDGCLGREVEGIKLYYKPADGFRGNDTFRFRYRYVEPDNEPVVVTFTVMVE